MKKHSKISATSQQVTELPAQGGFTRRTLVKGGAVALGAAVLGGMALSGCASEETASGEESSTESNSSSSEGTSTTTAGDTTFDYEVYETEALVVGGGLGGTSAANALTEAGKYVVIADKGPWRHSGTTGMGWDVYGGWFTPEELEAVGVDNPDFDTFGWTSPSNLPAQQKAILSDPNLNQTVWEANRGQIFPDRADNGELNPYFLASGTQGQFVRRHTDTALESEHTSVMDNFLVTDFLVSDGMCVGVVGVYLPTGKYRIIRSKATIISAGSSTWMYGWLTVKARTNSTADSTGDLSAAALRHGLGVSNSEFAMYDALSTSPTALGYGFGTGITADPAEADFVTDKDGNKIFDPDNPPASWADFGLAIEEAIQDGRGTDTGGVYVSIGDAELRPVNERNIPIQQKFGNNPREEPIEIAPEMFEHGGQPIVDDTMMTEIPGLFCSRVHRDGTAAWNNMVLGPYAGRCAASYIDSTDYPEEIDYSSALEEIQRLDDIRTRTADDGIRPHEIRHNIQNTCYSAMGILRKKENLDAAVEEFERIREEDMPRMTISSDSPTYNIEWRQAIENYNLLDMAELSVRATLAREESRGGYIRDDYPDQDDANWNCALVARCEDGEYSFEKLKYEEITW